MPSGYDAGQNTARPPNVTNPVSALLTSKNAQRDKPLAETFWPDESGLPCCDPAPCQSTSMQIHNQSMPPGNTIDRSPES
jgi:hypothetical protein